MSVINQVLNDIEHRNQAEAKQQDMFEPVQIDEINRLKPLYIVITILLILLITLSWWFFHNHSETNIIETNISQSGSVKQDIELVAAKTPEKTINAEPKQAIVKVPKRVENPVINQVATENTITESTSEKTKTPTQTVNVPAIEKVNKPTPKTVAAKASLSITPIEMSDDEVAQLKLNQGIKEQQLGNIDKAQKYWQQALALRPTLHDARLQLAASFYGANQTSQAIDLLVKATYQFPDYDGYRLLAAQVYYQQEKPQQALAILNSPFLKADVATENLVLAASIAQQLQQWQESLSNYQLLVTRDNNNSQWILGEAIGFDALGRSERAFQKYSQIISLPNVDSTITKYAAQRISALQNSINSRGNNG